MILNNSHQTGIFKYSDEVYFEKGDFVVDGTCIYVCESPQPVIGIRPSLDTSRDYYSEYPGNKITTASEYYDYVNSLDRQEAVEDKYVSSHVLCEILENMYFGFGDNGMVDDHVIYNPNTGIEYSIRGVREILDNSYMNVLNDIIRDNDLNNGLVRISRNLPEIRDLLVASSSESESSIILLKQYTYRNSSDSTPFRVQELMDPEKNKLYYRFAKGSVNEDNSIDFTDASVSSWKNLYSNNEDIINKLSAVDDYYNRKIQEAEDIYRIIEGRYCYREVIETPENGVGTNQVYLKAGRDKDLLSIDDFNYPFYITVIVKVPQDGGNIYKNYSTTIDVHDSQGATEIYNLQDGITITTSILVVNDEEVLNLRSSRGIIKNVYYRDDTLGRPRYRVNVTSNIVDLHPEYINGVSVSGGIKGTEYFYKGDIATLTVDPTEEGEEKWLGWVIEGDENNIISTDYTYQLTMPSNDVSYIAKFEAECTITIDENIPEGGEAFFVEGCVITIDNNGNGDVDFEDTYRITIDSNEEQGSVNFNN